jgi:hypothetical protein
MSRVASLIALLGLLLTSALKADSSSTPSAVALSASPARVVVVAPGRTRIVVANPGSERVVVDGVPAGYALDRAGRPFVRAARVGSPAAWLAVIPRTVVLAPGGRTELSVSASRRPGARPGDHAAVLLLTARPARGAAIVARMRVGVVVVVRVPGVLVHRLALGGVRVRRSGSFIRLDLAIANRGNVDEWLGAGRLRIALYRGGHRLVRVRPTPRRLLAGTAGLVEARYTGRARGRVTAVVELVHPTTGVRAVRRVYRLRL